jgi:hypothetical protein
VADPPKPSGQAQTSPSVFLVHSASLLLLLLLLLSLYASATTAPPPH